MSTTTMKVLSIRPTVEPRGSVLIARLWQFFAGLGAATVAAPRSREEEAAEVREMACKMQFTDPGFASDLFAAADRHERIA